MSNSQNPDFSSPPALLSAAEKRSYLAALEAAIYRGVEYVSYAGDQIKYRSLADMVSIRDLLRAELGLPSVKRHRPRPRRLVVKMG